MSTVREISKIALAAAIAVFVGPVAPASHASEPVLPGRQPGETTRLPGHLLPALATAVQASPASGAKDAELAITVVLRRDDQVGFERYLREVYDSRSPRFRRFSSPAEVSVRFGPTPEAYDAVLAHLRERGLTLVQGSASRLTATVRGTRSQVEQAFDLRIRDFESGGRRFFANTEDPALPPHLATRVQAVIGLSDFSRPRPAADTLVEALANSLLRGSGGAFRLLELWTPKAIAAAAAAPDADPVLLELIRRAGSAEGLLLKLQSALAMWSPPRPRP